FRLKETGVKDLGTLELVPAFAIRGRVYDPQKQPVAGARVEVIAGESRSRGLDILAMIKRFAESAPVLHAARTGNDGAYEILVPGPGTYSLRAWTDEWGQETVTNLKLGAARDGVDFYLFPAMAISGRVVDPNGAPVPGALLAVSTPMTMVRGGIPKTVDVTDAEGAFVLALNDSDDCMITVDADGFASHAESEIKAPQHGLVIELQWGAAFQLLVVEAGEAKVPVPGAEVMAVYGGSLATGVTDARGRLLLPHMPTKATTRGLGGESFALIHASGFVPKSMKLSGAVLKDGLIDAGTAELVRGGVIRGTVRLRGTDEAVSGASVRALGGLDQELAFGGGNRALSDAQGKFVLKGAPLGATAILATHEDHLPEAGNLMQQLTRMGVGDGKGQGLFKDGGSELEQDVYLTPAVTVEGIVRDPNGKPVAGAEVALVLGQNNQMAMIESFLLGLDRTAVTGADGSFRIGQLKQDTPIEIFARHRNFGPSATEKVTPPQEAVVDLKLVKPLSLEGKVLNEAGDPVAGARVNVSRKQGGARRSGFGNNPFRTDQGETRPAVTDADGKYVLHGAPTGELEVSAEHPSYVQEKTTVKADIETGSVPVPDLTLTRGNVIAGRILDADGDPVPNAYATANRVHAGVRSVVVAADEEVIEEVVEESAAAGGVAVDDGGKGRTVAGARTDRDGKFELVGLKRGKYNVEVRAPNMASAKIEAEANGPPLEIRLRKAAKLAGRVTHGGEGVAGVQVSARREGSWIEGTRTDGEGRFELGGLPPDEAITLVLSHSEYKEMRIEGVRAGSEPGDYRLQRGGVISGTLLDEQSQPVRGVRLSIQPLNAEGSHSWKPTTTDADGQFRFAGLDSYTYKIHLQSSGWILEDTPEVSPGDRTVQLRVFKGLSISGTLIDAAGNPVKGQWMMAQSGDGSSASSSTSEDGSFEIRGLRPGTYTVKAWGNQMVTAEVTGVEAGSTGITVQTSPK
ncbi:MAG: carboxypeptidase-like regulatory domain-containing protein, partial [Planctomycetota bacterium]|nr:carboxypeptidase-like regulatory domain-containing protein [Planctomycetota bacterium]